MARLDPRLLELLTQAISKNPKLTERAMVRGLARGRSPENMSALKQRRLQGRDARNEEKLELYTEMGGGSSTILEALKRAKAGRGSSKEVDDLRVIQQLLKLLDVAPRPTQGPNPIIPF